MLSENPKLPHTTIDLLVSVILINYNGGEDTLECIDSLLFSTYETIEIIVVDNHSIDGSVSTIRRRYPQVTLITLHENTGFAQGNNIGVAHAHGSYIMLLNNDTVVEKTAIEQLVLSLRKETRYIAVVPKIYCFDKKTIDSCGSRFNNLGFGYGIGANEPDRKQYDVQKEVPALSACCVLFDRKILNKTYLFDPKYFMYLEEIDLSIRLQRLGLHIGYCPQATIYHKRSRSVERSSDNNLLFKRYYAEKNRIHLLVKYYPLFLLVKSFPLILVSILYWDLILLIRSNWKKWFSYKQAQCQEFARGRKERFKLEKAENSAWYKVIDTITLKEIIYWSIHYFYVSKNK